MLAVRLSTGIGSLQVQEYADDLSFAGEVLNRWVHVGRASLSRHRRRQGGSSDLELQPVPPVCAQCQGDHVGLSPAAGDLAIDENAPIRGSPSRCSH